MLSDPFQSSQNYVVGEYNYKSMKLTKLGTYVKVTQITIFVSELKV